MCVSECVCRCMGVGVCYDLSLTTFEVHFFLCF